MVLAKLVIDMCDMAEEYQLTERYDDKFKISDLENKILTINIKDFRGHVRHFARQMLYSTYINSGKNLDYKDKQDIKEITNELIAIPQNYQYIDSYMKTRGADWAKSDFLEIKN